MLDEDTGKGGCVSVQSEKMISKTRSLQQQGRDLPNGDTLEKILSNKNINSGRQREVDMIKFFAISFMICIHIYEQFGGYDFANKIPDTLLPHLFSCSLWASE